MHRAFVLFQQKTERTTKKLKTEKTQSTPTAKNRAVLRKEKKNQIQLPRKSSKWLSSRQEELSWRRGNYTIINYKHRRHITFRWTRILSASAGLSKIETLKAAIRDHILLYFIFRMTWPSVTQTFAFQNGIYIQKR